MRKCSRFDFVSLGDDDDDDDDDEEEEEKDDGDDMVVIRTIRDEKKSLLECLKEMNESGRQIIGQFWENVEMREAFSVWWTELSTTKERMHLILAAKSSSLDSFEGNQRATPKSSNRPRSDETNHREFNILFEENDEFATTLCALQRIVAPELTRPQHHDDIAILPLFGLLGENKENSVFSSVSSSSSSVAPSIQTFTLREAIAAAIRQELELISSLSSDILKSRKEVRLLVREAFDALAMKLCGCASTAEEEKERLCLLPLLMEARRIALRDLSLQRQPVIHSSDDSNWGEEEGEVNDVVINKDEDELLTLVGLKTVRTHVFTRFFGALIVEFLQLTLENDDFMNGDEGT